MPPVQTVTPVHLSIVRRRKIRGKIGLE